MDKREHLIRTAFTLFYRHGIHAVGINRILEESGIAKKTLYHHFASKEELVEAALEYRDQVYLDWLGGRLAAVPAGRQGIAELFRSLDDWFNGRVRELKPYRGCFFINASAEYGDRQHPVHRACAEHKRKVTGLIHEQVEALSIPRKQAEVVSETLLLLKEGATVLAHVQGDLDAAQRAGRAAEQLLALLKNA